MKNGELLEKIYEHLYVKENDEEVDDIWSVWWDFYGIKKQVELMRFYASSLEIALWSSGHHPYWILSFPAKLSKSQFLSMFHFKILEIVQKELGGG